GGWVPGKGAWKKSAKGAPRGRQTLRGREERRLVFPGGPRGGQLGFLVGREDRAGLGPPLLRLGVPPGQRVLDGGFEWRMPQSGGHRPAWRRVHLADTITHRRVPPPQGGFSLPLEARGRPRGRHPLARPLFPWLRPPPPP